MTIPFIGFHKWVDCDLEVLWVELKQILHLKFGCSDFGPVWDGQFKMDKKIWIGNYQLFG